MLMFEGFHYDGDIIVLVSVEFEEETEKYLVEVTRGLERKYRTFTPKYLPEGESMHVSDLEKSVKISNVLIKELKRRKK